MRTTALRVAQKQEGHQRVDQQDMFHCVVFFLAALTIALFSRVLGAPDTSLGAVIGKRGPSGAALTVG